MKIQIPRNLNEAQRKLYEEIAKLEDKETVNRKNRNGFSSGSGSGGGSTGKEGEKAGSGGDSGFFDKMKFWK